MIIGNFDNGSPFVEGLLVIRRLNIQEPISFLVDTGADLTSLMPADGHRIGLNYASLRLNQRRTIYGDSGSIRVWWENAFVLLTEADATERTYRIRLQIFPDVPRLQDLDSLLGQEIISRWRMVHDPSKGHLGFTVRSADATRRPP